MAQILNSYAESNYDTDVKIGYDGSTIVIDRIGCGVATGANGGTLI